MVAFSRSLTRCIISARTGIELRQHHREILSTTIQPPQRPLSRRNRKRCMDSMKHWLSATALREPHSHGFPCYHPRSNLSLNLLPGLPTRIFERRKQLLESGKLALNFNLRRNAARFTVTQAHLSVHARTILAKKLPRNHIARGNRVLVYPCFDLSSSAVLTLDCPRTLLMASAQAPIFAFTCGGRNNVSGSSPCGFPRWLGGRTQIRLYR